MAGVIDRPNPNLDLDSNTGEITEAMPVPRIADVSCIPIRFRPGDRLLVKVNHMLDPGSKARLKKSIERWAGDQVEVLIIELPLLEIDIIQSPLGVK